MRAKAFMAETAAAARRGELIERKLVEFQASYLFIAMRQRILRLPVECAPQLAGLTDVHEISSRASASPQEHDLPMAGAPTTDW